MSRDGQDENENFEGDQADHYPLQEMSMLNIHFLREHAVGLPDSSNLPIDAVRPLVAP